MLAVAHAHGRLIDARGREIKKEIGEMDPDDLALWIAWLNERSPDAFRYQAENWRAAVIASTIKNCRFGWAADSSPKDFMPDNAQPAEPDAEQMESALKAWCVNQGGKVVRGAKR